MARNAPKHTQPTATDAPQDGEQPSPDWLIEDDQTSPRGGASGVIEEASKTITRSPEDIVAEAKATADARAAEEQAQAEKSPFASDNRPPEPRKFRVTNQQTVLVMYGGMQHPVRPGKVVAEHEMDLEHLRKQGVVFEQISGPPPEEPKTSAAKADEPKGE